MIFALGIFIGLVMGLTGAGGAILAVPLLMALTSLPLVEAAPVALLTVASAAALGAYLAWRKSHVRYRAAGLMALIGALTAPLGLSVAVRVPNAWLSLLFSFVLAFVGLRLWRQAMGTLQEKAVDAAELQISAEPRNERFCRLNDSTGRLIWTGSCTLCIAVTGAVTGFLSGLLGVGGGFFIVPALHSTTELSMSSAVGTSLMAIALTSLGVVAVAVFKGHAVPVLLALPMIGGALLGICAGRSLAPYLSGAKLQLCFASLLGVVALQMAARATGHF